MQLPVEDGGHSLHQLLSLSRQRDITGGARDVELHAFPFLQARLQLRLVPSARVHCCSEPCELFDDGVPPGIKLINMYSNSVCFFLFLMVMMIPDSFGAAGDQSCRSEKRPSAIHHFVIP